MAYHNTVCAQMLAQDTAQPLADASALATQLV